MPDPQALLRRRPFAAVAPLVRISPLSGDGAHSGGAFLAEAEDGRRFKLRVCRSRRRARQLEATLRAVPEFFAALVAREGRLLLIEYLEGEAPSDRKRLRPYASDLGRFYAEIHRRGARRGAAGRLRTLLESLRIRLQLVRQLRVLARVDAGLARQVRAQMTRWRGSYGIPVALELWDTHKANFLIGGDGRLHYVDEDGLHYAMQGMGLGKLLADPGVRPGSPKRTREWYAFCEGYAQVGDAGFLTPEYCAYARLLELIRSIEFKLRKDQRVHKLDDELAELRELVGPGIKRPPLPSDDDFGLKREPKRGELDEPS
jgi:hypothetical protein